ncbi:MAG TPA: NlpC/P60 family protein [Anaerolineales bacterium]|nr:NlpC/P60 family protein [Anaerolineales bacterium]
MREIALKIAYSYLGTPYIWGGDDPSGFDCSGFCIEILQSVGCLPRNGDWTADQLADLWQRTRSDDPGNLVFWRSDGGKVIHVEMCIGDGLAIGASGGGSKTTTIAAAIKQNAFIKIRPINSRPKVWGYTNPFGDKK